MVAQRKEATTLRQPSLEFSTSPVFLACQAVPTASWADPALRNCSRQEVGCMPTDHRELSRGHGVKWLCGLRTPGRPAAHPRSRCVTLILAAA